MRNLVITMIVLVLLLSACSMEPPGWAKSNRKTNEKEIKIGLSVSTLNNPFFVSLKDGVMKEAKASGMKVKVVDAQNDSAKQINDIEDLIQQDVDILLINPTDSSAISTGVQAANNMAIPVITLDRASEKGQVESLVASDNVKGGEMAAEYIVETLGENIEVAELEGVPGASATRERGKGFHNIADEKLKVVAKQSADFDRTKGLTVMENILQANPNIQAVFAHNDEMALGAIETINSSGKDIMVIGFDGNDDAIKAVNSGKMQATIAQQPDKIGQLAVQAARKVMQGKKIEKKIPVPLKLMDRE